ncbi:MFS general substrate transporter [Acephala macrosclerotiorum]|nr:MFS general substrate transporter [Acephala macrosclerotiorum]
MRIASRLTRAPTFYHPREHTPTTLDVIVDFDGPDDPYRPMNWPFSKKAYTALIYGLVTMGATWGSSIYAEANEDISREFHIGSIVTTLDVTLYMSGFGTGPLIWAPLSENSGRRTAVFYPCFIGVIFAFGSATAKDTQTLMLTRFWGGFFASAPVTNAGGVLGDLWTPAQRGPGMAAYAMAVANGTLLAPIVGGAIVDSYLSWRWTEYVSIALFHPRLLQIFILLIVVIFTDESYAPTLLYFVRPFQLLATPITACIAAYSSFVYGILYLCFTAFPIEFEEERRWNHLVGSFPFLGSLVGCITGALGNSLNTNYYISRVKANNGRPVPELCPCIGAYFIELGFITIFQCALNYLIDNFQIYAASAVAGNTSLRSVFAGVFPLFAPAMFHDLGIEWASSVIWFVAVALVPIPFVFLVYGKRMRSRGSGLG